MDTASKENLDFIGESSKQAPATMPTKTETWVDEQVNSINRYKAIAERTGLSLRQATWFCLRNVDDVVMPEP